VPLHVKEEEMKFQRIFTPAVLILTLLVQFLPGTAFSPRPVAAAGCDAAEFVADITIPDGTNYAPGSALIKTWRLKNVGTCTWSTSYAIVFYAGTKMGAPSVVNLPTSVAPGATVDVTVNMTAPTAAGHYRGHWMLRNASSVLFGMGPYGTYSFFIDIVVSGSSTATVYDLVANSCSATWTSGAGVLPCPGVDGSASGYAFQSASPLLENGTNDTVPGLIVAPQNITDGFISGTYPAFLVQSGDRFQSIVSCAYGVPSCYVTFQLDYQVGSGPVYTLWHFHEKTDGMYYRASVDLSSLAGQNVKFTIKVSASGTPAGDRVLWGGARITRIGSAPISTCDRAAFVADVTIPDGTAMAGGTAFTKTWRLQNVGTCTWTTSYRLVFAGGDLMGVSSSAFNLPTSVAPGGTVDLSLNLTAPITAGNYIGYWKLRNASGTDFGVGTSGTSAFLVNVNVSSAYSSAYNYVTNACDASWSSGAGALPCPGTDGDARGFVLKLGSHLMEDGVSSPEGLLTFPQYITDGYIQGIYPGFTVQSGDHFQSYVGCQNGGPTNCYVIFRLAYQIGAGPVVTLKTAAERLDTPSGLVYRMDVDLGALAGENVKFILRVEAFGSASGDRAVWSAPRIVRSGGLPPSPTSTPGPGPTATPIAPSPTSTGVIVGPNADLSITINDSLGTYTPGSTATYTVVVHNAGPYAVTGASVTVNKPVQITSWTVTCAMSAGSVCTAGPVTPAGNITDSVTIPVGGNLTYTIVSSISASAVGNMVTSATITNPGPTPDPNIANNSASDTDAPPSADLSITINDGISLWTPGGTTTYTVVVTNNGPLNVTGAVFTDNKPAQITSWSWTCTPASGATCGAGSAGAIVIGITDTVNIPSGKSVTYTIMATLGTAIPGNLVNTVTIAAPIGMPDPVLGNNTATDTDAGPSADLSVTKTDGVAYYTPGGTLTYTIRVVNNGPQTVIGATFDDNKPSQISAWTWTCVPDFSSTCTSPGVVAGDFSDTLNLAAGQGVTYTVVATVGSPVTGNLVNTASVASPGAITDPVPGNNSATDTDAAPTADLSVSMTDGLAIYPPGGTVTYTIVVTNNGPTPITGAPLTGATIDDTKPASVTSWIWTCVPDSGATCTSPGVPSVANFHDHINLPVGTKVTYTVVASVSVAAIGDMVNSVTVTAPADVPDPILANNIATDTDLHPYADLAITITDMVLTYDPGGLPLIYTITVTNSGPSNVIGAAFSDTATAEMVAWTWTCAPELGASCVTGTVVGPPVFTDTVNIPSGKSIVYTVTVTTNALAVTPLIHTVSIMPPAIIMDDPNLVNNTAQDTDTPLP
jgi:uncharacterized repeat protein (TIGR01451 family)